ncbi:AAA family ATPase [Candidatus Mycobacterium wuenschmannii]|uniref:AAA family ATPase n=1 Tax=Candidatus Mycobacterium wuenschmannii TaxID=3027808 RepID=A0ABY8W4E2_9MYCO|nr:AAA family ATPase [Candidatus Mycobacterium wuenschmannii]WIM89907.1 AAA family ATPase [Candidatus Mycobacterium wuenschmannii]
MPSPWVAAPPEAALRAIAAGLEDAQHSGVAIAGADGVGKTTLARGAAPADAHWVRGTATERSIPFGAFRALLADLEIGDDDRPAQLLRSAQDQLAGSGHFVVDDAHHLDRMSATLVYQLALTGSATLIVTVRSGAELPEAVRALWDDGLLARVEVATPDTAASLPATVDDFLAGLPEAARATLDYLALAEPLRRDDLAALAGADAVAQAEAADAVTVDADGYAYAAHPLYAARAGAAQPPDTARALRLALAERLSETPSGWVGDQLRLASLAVDADAPSDHLVTAAQQALRFGELTLAERLARAALDRAEGLAARLALGYALAWQGRGLQADAVLAEVDPERLSPPEVMAWALPRAANQFWMLSEPAQATAFLQTTRSRVDSPGAQATLDALSATFAMNAGTPLRTLRIAEEVLASPHADAVAVGWASSAAALSSARTGRFEDVEALARRATAADHPGLLRFTSGFGRITALLMAGRLTEARTLAQRYTDFAELQQPGRAIGETLVGYVAIAQGDFEDAVTLLSRATEPLARTGYSWGPLSLMLLSQALGQQGEQLHAGKVLSRAEQLHGLKSALFAPELALARAWSRAAHGDTTGAIEAAREAVQTAERGGQSAVALRALQDCARLGDLRAAQRAGRLAGEVNCVLGRLTLAHARALTAGDVAALAEVATDLADRGLHPAAADAKAQAERL